MFIRIVIALCTLTTTVHASIRPYPLQHAVIENDMPELIQLMRKGWFGVNTRDLSNKTALHYAAASLNLDAIKILLLYDADAELADGDDKIPFTFAAINNENVLDSFLAASELLQAMARGKRKGAAPHYVPPLHLEGMSEYIASVQQLITASMPLPKVLKIAYMPTLLHDEQLVRFLIASDKADGGVRAYVNRQLLADAAMAGSERAVELLLEYVSGDDINSYERGTPLMLAATYGHVKVVELLLQSITGIDSTNNTGYSALMLAAAYQHTEVVILLLQYGAKFTDEQRLVLQQDDKLEAIEIIDNAQLELQNNHSPSS